MSSTVPRLYRLRQIGSNVGNSYQSIRLPQEMYGDRFPKFRQIFIQNTAASGGPNLLIKFAEDAESQWTLTPGSSPLDINVSAEEAIEVEHLLLKSSTGTACSYEIILMYEVNSSDR